jgi:hypothetical protein
MKTLEFMLSLLSEMNILEEEEIMIFEQWNVINVTNCVFVLPYCPWCYWPDNDELEINYPT